MQEISETLLGFFETLPVIKGLLKTTESAQSGALFLSERLESYFKGSEDR